MLVELRGLTGFEPRSVPKPIRTNSALISETSPRWLPLWYEALANFLLTSENEVSRVWEYYGKNKVLEHAEAHDSRPPAILAEFRESVPQNH